MRRWSGRWAHACARSASLRSTPRRTRTAWARASRTGPSVRGRGLGASEAGVPAPCWTGAGASFGAFFCVAFLGELRVDTRPDVAPHAARRPIAASRLSGSGSSACAAAFWPPRFAAPLTEPALPLPSARVPVPAASACAPVDSATARAGSSPACSIQRATDAATSGAGASRRRTPLGRARIASVSRSSRMPGTSQSVPASLTRSSTSIGMRIDTPSRGLPGANS